ncbi:carbohydrate binding domain-containing protein [Novipirellula caenicola]|uniref:carbohydrate binding domain-containing protein n=1 Tax=Novipirellula caenicola TaxID=1536901 RepID=UPI0031ED6D3B
MNPNRLGARQRDGAIYAIVLFSSLIVASIGLASLQLMRLQGRSAEESDDFIAARVYARAAVDIGMLRVRRDPFWRTQLGNGDWITRQSMDRGTFSLSATDPVDGDVTVGDNHPVVLTGTGQQGDARFQISVRLEVGPQTGSCLEVSMISGDDLDVDGTTLSSDQSICSNEKVDAGGGAVINANVEAYDNIDGSSYTKSTQQRTTRRTMPDPLHALDYYLSNGTTIDYSSLRTWPQPEILLNTTFESGTQNWVAQGDCTLQRSLMQKKDGLYSLRVTGRADQHAVAVQAISPDKLRSGDTYDVLLNVYPTANAKVQAVLTLETSDAASLSFMTSETTLDSNQWGRVGGRLTPTWSGTLTKATLHLLMDIADDYFMDSVSLLNTTYPADSYVLDGLLTPHHNPFGGSTNAKGIYLINCAGKDVRVGKSRIVGTLVFLNPGSDSIIHGPLVWEPAEQNYPALLTDATLWIGLSAAGFNETQVGTNLNPPETPYPINGGTSNSSFSDTDSYPSQISGLIYSTRDLRFSGESTICGIVIAEEKIRIEATSLNLNYDSSYLENPPPGFDAETVTMKVVPGTWQRQVN